LPGLIVVTFFGNLIFLKKIRKSLYLQCQLKYLSIIETPLPQLFIISEEWTEQQWFNTGGTRAKKYLLSPDRKYFYFKRSQFKEATQTKPAKDFTYEFWNEIIAYEVGSLLGFKMLRYDLAIDGEIMGCISESMINSDKEELIEGVKYLQAYSPDYDPGKKEHRTWYTFDLIEGALKAAKIGGFINDILEIIVFDALIGNGDRHQENWAAITHQRLLTDIASEEMEATKKPNRIFRSLLNILKSLEIKQKELNPKLPGIYYRLETKFAPIYDSGSSLGRELLEDTLEFYLKSEKDLEKYISKGTSEIHWENKKVSHFELIRNLLSSSYKDAITNIINRVVEKYDSAKIETILGEVDQKTPETLSRYMIPASRKRLILKIITLRFEMLRALTNG
jgi:hypothetical protein